MYNKNYIYIYISKTIIKICKIYNKYMYNKKIYIYK